MRKCNKMICTLVLLVFAVAILSSCSHVMTKETALLITASYSVPCTYITELKGGDAVVDIVEKDDYGRILFSLSCYCMFSGTYERVSLISQKIDKDFVYYYDDVNYLFGNNEDQIEQLKADNDWNNGMIEEKLTKHSKKMSFDLWLISDASLSTSRVFRQIKTDLNVNDEQIVRYSFSDVDADGRELYTATVDKNGIWEYYFLIIDPEYDMDTFSYHAEYLQIEDPCDYRSDLIDFKRRCGWN